MDQEALKLEYDTLLTQLSSGKLTPPELATASKRLKELGDMLARFERQEARQRRRKETETMLKESADPELRALAEEELAALMREEEQEKRTAASPGNKKETAIMEIRPGTGGDEAALFAADLGRMYQRFAERRGWKVTLLDDSRSDLGGIKSLTFAIDGKGAFTSLQYEGGVHRVQRIPTTEKSGRIHTSTATVVVLPKVTLEEFHVPANELRIDTMRAGGPGGQLVNRRESAVRILHVPTGIMVTSQTARTQNANREYAMEILLAKLADKKRLEEEAKSGAARKAQIGTGDRSEKIRTYNFPQDRITDHRINESWHHLPAILDGDIDEIISALQEKTVNA